MSLVGQVNEPFTLEEEVVAKGAVSASWHSVGGFWGRLSVQGSGADKTYQIIMRDNPTSKVSVGQRVAHKDLYYLICDVCDLSVPKGWLKLTLQKQEYLN